MKSRIVPRAAAGFAFVFVAGLALTLLPAAGASPSPALGASEFSGPGTTTPGSAVHSIQGPCSTTVAAVGPVGPVHIGQPFHLLVVVHVQTMTLGAKCPAVVFYAWTHLPGGCTAARAPSLTCVPMTGGLYQPTAIVGLSNGSFLSATTAVSVVGGWSLS